jgi:hypothetical protein
MRELRQSPSRISLSVAIMLVLMVAAIVARVLRAFR